LFKRPIYRILFFSGWILLLGGIITLLIAANRRNEGQLCKGVSITINNGNSIIFVAKEDVLRCIEKTAKGPLIKKHFGELNLNALEQTLETNPWIQDAEMYFDTKDILHVLVIERIPVARVFTTAGVSFYIDSAGYQMPLVEKYSVRLPLVTGYMASKKWNTKDSALLINLKKLLQVICANEFWKAQIGQVDITPNKKFELIPTIGNGVIRLGDASAIENKLGRLFNFYKQVIPKVGFAKYSVLDLQFDGQIVAVKKGPQSPVDSIQLQKNIQELMRRKAVEQEAEGIEPELNMQMPKYPSIELVTDTTQNNAGDKKQEPIIEKDVPANPPSRKNPEQKSNLTKPKQQIKPVQKPKAVMQARNGY
jgi:cell division protein FtsQ